RMSFIETRGPYRSFIPLRLIQDDGLCCCKRPGISTKPRTRFCLTRSLRISLLRRKTISANHHYWNAAFVIKRVCHPDRSEQSERREGSVGDKDID
ncbi:MAG: hypothetical protein LAT80_14045, partial [Balneolaceae bacterium]|nr:hypothetical protein [Balneolaceae bacterium]